MPKDEFVQYMLNILDSSATYTAGIDQNLTNEFIVSLQNFIEQPQRQPLDYVQQYNHQHQVKTLKMK